MGRMVSGRMATVNGGEEPLLAITLNINMQKSRNQGSQDDNKAKTTLQMQSLIRNMIHEHEDMDKSYFLYNHLSLSLMYTKPSMTSCIFSIHDSSTYYPFSSY